MSTTKRLLSNSLIVFIGTFLGSVFAYLFNMLMGRMLGPVAYGEMTALMSLMMIIGVAGGAIFTISMRYSGEMIAIGEYSALAKLFRFLSRNVLFFGLGLLVIGLVLVKPIGQFFSIRSTWPVIISLVSVVFGLMIAINRGFLQGAQKFFAISVFGSLESFLRLIVGLLLVYLGFSLNGALSAIVMATAVVYALSYLPLRKILKLKDKIVSKSTFKFDKKEIINYSWPTLIAAVFLILAINLDVILVKHFFSPEEAGVYAAISTIGKIILYISAPIIGVMFPMISEQKAKGSKHYRLFLFSLVITLVSSLAILAIYVIAPGKVISILYGQKYVGAYSLLPEVGLAILFYSLFNLISNYYLAIRNFIFLWFFALTLVAQVVIISLWHPTLVAVIRTLILTNATLFVLMFGYYLVIKWSQIKSYIFREVEE